MNQPIGDVRLVNVTKFRITHEESVIRPRRIRAAGQLLAYFENIVFESKLKQRHVGLFPFSPPKFPPRGKQIFKTDYPIKNIIMKTPPRHV